MCDICGDFKKRDFGGQYVLTKSRTTYGGFKYITIEEELACVDVSLCNQCYKKRIEAINTRKRSFLEFWLSPIKWIPTEGEMLKELAYEKFYKIKPKEAVEGITEDGGLKFGPRYYIKSKLEWDMERRERSL